MSDIKWQQGEFIDSREYSHMPKNWKEFQIHNEKKLVRPSPKGNAICKTNNPDDAVWIAERLNKADEYDKRIAELEKENRKALGWIGKAMMQGLNDIDCSDELLKITDKRDLEMQIKGIEDAIEYASHNKIYYIDGISNVENICQTEDLIAYAEKLQEQVKE